MTEDEKNKITLEKFQHNYQSALAAKESGNAALKEGKLKSASFHYKRVYLYLAEYLPTVMTPHYYNQTQNNSEGMTDLIGGEKKKKNEQDRLNLILSKVLSMEQKTQNVKLHVTSLNNLCLVDYKLGRYKESRDGASDVISFCEFYRIHNDNENDRKEWTSLQCKARLRRASAYLMLGDYEKAEEDVEILKKEGYADPMMDSIVQQIKVKQSAEREKGRKMARLMFQ